MAHNDKPWGLGAVDGSQILEEPLVLLVVLVLSNVAVDCTEWATVGDESLASVGWVSLPLISRAKGHSGLYGKSVSPSMETK